MHFRCQQIFEYAWPVAAVFQNGSNHSFLEFCGINFNQFAKKTGIHAFDLGRRHFQIKHDGIIQDGFPIPVVYDTPVGIAHFGIYGIVEGKGFIFAGKQLKIYQLCHDDQEYPRHYQTDNC